MIHTLVYRPFGSEITFTAVNWTFLWKRKNNIRPTHGLHKLGWFSIVKCVSCKKIISDLSLFRWAKIWALLTGPFSPWTFQLTILVVSHVITPLTITLLWVYYYFPFVKGRGSVHPRQLWTPWEKRNQIKSYIGIYCIISHKKYKSNYQSLHLSHTAHEDLTIPLANQASDPSCTRVPHSVLLFTCCIQMSLCRTLRQIEESAGGRRSSEGLFSEQMCCNFNAMNYIDVDNSVSLHISLKKYMYIPPSPRGSTHHGLTYILSWPISPLWLKMWLIVQS